MPYITFSRNFPDEAKVYRLLLNNGEIVERRGTKTIRKIAQRAAYHGFNSALLGMEVSGKVLKCRELKILTDSADRLRWKYSSKTVKLDLNVK